ARLPSSVLAFLLFAGSFTTIRRRRLASPTSIVRNRSHAPPCQVPHRCVSVGAAVTSYRRPGSFRQGLQPLLQVVYSTPSIRRNQCPVAAPTPSPSPCWPA